MFRLLTLSRQLRAYGGEQNWSVSNCKGTISKVQQTWLQK